MTSPTPRSSSTPALGRQDHRYFQEEVGAISKVLADLSLRVGQLQGFHEDVHKKCSRLTECNKNLRKELVRLQVAVPPSPPNEVPPSPPDTHKDGDKLSEELHTLCESKCAVDAGPEDAVLNPSLPADRATSPSLTEDGAPLHMGKMDSLHSAGEAEVALRQIWTDVRPGALQACKARYSFTVVDGGLARRSSFRRQNTLTNIHAHLPNINAPALTQDAESSERSGWTCSTVMHPLGSAKLSWNLVSLGFIAYDLLVIPLQVYDLEDEPFLAAMEWVGTIFWTLDMLLCFRTGFVSDAKIETRTLAIALHYAKTWLAVDLAIVTLEWVSRCADVIGGAGLLRGSRILRVIRLVKLLRLCKMGGLWSAMTEQINSNVIHLLSTMFVLLLLLIISIHIISCIWYLVGNSDSNGWVSYDTYKGRKDVAFWYTASSRWVIAQLNGRTDMDERRTMKERLFTCAVGVSFAVLAQATFISVITKTMLDLSDLVSEKTRVRRLVNEYLHHHPVPQVLTITVKRYLRDYQDVGKEQENEENVLSLLPQNVRDELVFAVRSPSLNANALFSSLLKVSMWSIRHVSRTAVKPIAALKHDVVFNMGEACSEMLFADKVVSRYYHGEAPDVGGFQNWLPEHDGGFQSVGESTRNIRVDPRTWICEPAVWVEWVHKGTLVAETHGSMYRVDAKDLAEALMKHPDAFVIAALYASTLVDALRHVNTLDDLNNFEIQFEEATPIHLRITALSAHNLYNSDFLTGKSDPYCICKVLDWCKSRSKKVFTTKTIDDCLDPVWEHTGMVDIAEGQSLLFEVWDHEIIASDRLLGAVCLEYGSFMHDGGGFEGELELTGGIGKGYKGTISIKVTVEQIDDGLLIQKSLNLPRWAADGPHLGS